MHLPRIRRRSSASCPRPLTGQAEPIPYDGPGTDAGNGYKAKKQLSAYDDDARATIDLLVSLPNCNGRIGATGMSVGITAIHLTGTGASAEGWRSVARSTSASRRHSGARTDRVRADHTAFLRPTSTARYLRSVCRRLTSADPWDAAAIGFLEARGGDHWRAGHGLCAPCGLPV